MSLLILIALCLACAWNFVVWGYIVLFRIEVIERTRVKFGAVVYYVNLAFVALIILTLALHD